MKFYEHLKEIEACKAAVKWVGRRGIRKAWAECQRADWMLWLVGKMSGRDGWPDRKTVVEAACECAGMSLRFVRAGEYRPHDAIETAWAWIDGRATPQEVRAYADAAYAVAAAAAAYADDAAAAAYAVAAAAHAADAAYAVAAAAYAAAYAADAAAAAYADDAAYAAYAVENKRWQACLADIVRRAIPADSLPSRC